MSLTKKEKEDKKYTKSQFLKDIASRVNKGDVERAFVHVFGEDEEQMERFLVENSKLSIYRARTVIKNAISNIEKKSNQHKSTLLPLPKKKDAESDLYEILNRYGSQLGFSNYLIQTTYDELVKNSINRTSDKKKQIEELEILYSLLLSKAKGEIVTRETIIRYSIDEQGNKAIIYDEDGNRVVTEKTVSHLPTTIDTQKMLLIREAIESLRDEGYVITEEELQREYLKRLEKISKDKIKATNRNFSDD